MNTESDQPDAYRSTGGTPVVPSAPSRIDLHLHTTASDGVRRPRDLVLDVMAAGVTLLALTDHDTLAGYREVTTGPSMPIEILPGVEFNAIADHVPGLWEGELHVLGLGVNPDDDAFEAALDDQRSRRARRFEQMVGRLRELGVDLGPALEANPPGADEALGRPHLARVLVAAGHADSVDDAMRRFLARGQPGWAPRTGLGPEAAIRAIRSAGGLAVLAHFADAPDRRALIRELAEMGLGGLEVHYRRFSLETVAAVGAVARDLGLVATGGSDYHGDNESYADAHAELAVPDPVGRTLHAVLGAFATGPR